MDSSVKTEDQYSSSLAEIHSRHFQHLAEAAAREVVERMPLEGKSRSLFDIGCGSGEMLANLLSLGYEVAGCDLSAPMIQLAKSKLPENTNLSVGSASDCVLPKNLDVVTAVGEVLSYAFDEAATGDDYLSEVFNRVRSALNPDGIFLFDCAGPGRGQSGDQCFHREDLFLAVKSRERGKFLFREMTYFIREPKTGLWERRDECHRLILRDLETVERQLQAAGFDAERLPGYGGEPPPAGWWVLCATPDGG